MNTHTISVYQRGESFRVVRGEHNKGAFGKGVTPRVYDSAEDAYTTEGDPAIKEAIARISPAARMIAKSAQHHIVRGGHAEHALKVAEAGDSVKLLGTYFVLGDKNKTVFGSYNFTNVDGSQRKAREAANRRAHSITLAGTPCSVKLETK